ncbi:MAG: RDD family protein [Dehalococcoidia bacterium]|nr:RDD family protein [Dehalococcoidia bacterium]
MVQCPRCSHTQDDAAIYCASCGVFLGKGSGGAPVVKPEQGETATAYAGFWKRAGAWIIDTIPIVIVNFIITGVVFGFDRNTGDGNNQFQFERTAEMGAEMLLSVGINWAYFALMESSPKQATLGKMALGIIVTDTQGQRISFARATGRYFAEFLSWFTVLVGFFMAGWTPKKQGLHDIIAGTLVVNQPKTAQPQQPLSGGGR